MTIKQALARGSERIARADAELLLRHATGHDRAWLMAHPEAELDARRVAVFEGLLARRAAHEPVQYITGHQEFFGLDLHVAPGVLIPRPETELLVEAVLAWAGRQPERAGESPTLRIVDVGTGSGAIALALASRLTEAEIWAVDVAEAARRALEINGERTGLAGCVRFMESDLLEAFAPEIARGRRFDVVVSNPPYVPLREAASLAREVREFEPPVALFGGDDGLEVYPRLIPQAWDGLRAGGLLALEIGWGQADAVRGLLDGWTGVTVTPDYAGIARVVEATRP